MWKNMARMIKWKYFFGCVLLLILFCKMDPSEKASHVRKESGTQSVGSKIREDLIS